MPEIAHWIQTLKHDFGYAALVACEIEFYLSAPIPDRFWDLLREQNLPIANTEAERGLHQYEVALLPEAPGQAAAHAEALKLALIQQATAFGIKVDFSAKPFPDQPGSGLHVHVHLEDAQGQRVYYKDDNTISDPLAFSIGGLLACMREDLPIFAPTPASRARFAKGSNSPLTLSWGANNRSCAIRLPDKPHAKKHIEHRVAGADADVTATIAAILRGIHHGLSHRITPGPQIYGDASLPQYNLPPLFDSNQ